MKKFVLAAFAFTTLTASAATAYETTTVRATEETAAAAVAEMVDMYAPKPINWEKVRKTFHKIRVWIDRIDDACCAGAKIWVDNNNPGTSTPGVLLLDEMDIASAEASGIRVQGGTIFVPEDIVLETSSDGSKQLVVVAGTFRIGQTEEGIESANVTVAVKAVN